MPVFRFPSRFLCFLLMAFTSTGCTRDGAKANKGAQETGLAPPSYVALAAEEFVKEFLVDSKKADEKYNKKQVLLTGEIHELKIQERQNPFGPGATKKDVTIYLCGAKINSDDLHRVDVAADLIWDGDAQLNSILSLRPKQKVKLLGWVCAEERHFLDNMPQGSLPVRLCLSTLREVAEK
jgi:hypothetical protein